MKHSTRWHLRLAAAGLGIVMVLAACGETDDLVVDDPDAPDDVPAADTDRPFEGVTLQFAKAPHGERELELFEEWLAPFEEETGIEVEHTVVPWDQLEAIYTANFAGDDPFDVTYQVSTHLTMFGERGAFEDMTPYFYGDEYAEEAERWPESVVQASVYQDKLYGVPFITGTIVMFYNQDMLDEAGLDVPETTEELIAAAQELADPPETWGFYTPTTVRDFGWYFNLQNVKNLNGDIVSDDLTEATIDSPEVIQATEHAADLICEYEVQPPVGAYDREGGIELFKAGKLAFLLDEPLRITVFEEEGLPFEWDIALPVGAPDGRRTTFSTTGHWSMAAGSDNKEAAWELIKYLSTPEFSETYNLEYAFVPARDDVDVSGGNPRVQQNAEWAAEFWDGLRTHPKIAEILDTYVAALEAATTCDTPAEEALTSAQGRAEAILEEG